MEMRSLVIRYFPALASFIAMPFYTLKTRAQLKIQPGLLRTLQEEGPAALFVGWDAFLPRQLAAIMLSQTIFRAIRHYEVKEHEADVEEGKETTPPTLLARLAKSYLFVNVTSCVISRLLVTPISVAYCRIIADTIFPPHSRKYTGLFTTLAHIYSEEGITALWSGILSEAIRAAISGLTPIAYALTKDVLWRYSVPELPRSLLALCISGLLRFLEAPFDYITVQVQGNSRFGPLDVISNTINNEGTFAFWRGSLMFYLFGYLSHFITFGLLHLNQIGKLSSFFDYFRFNK